jgi:three-Cys-motif partner protein
MTTDIHSKAFDEGTQIKLYILREYLKQWLPVFLNRKPVLWKRLFLYDFFAGEGSDAIGNYGSPLIILDELRSYCKSINSESIEVNVVFNEYLKGKSQKLKLQCSEQLEMCKLNPESANYCPNFGKNGDCVFKLLIENKDFNDFFQDKYPHMSSSKDMPKFMFLDQYGIKYITEEIFHKLTTLERTDFIFFISSSFARRFIENAEFKRYLNLTRQDFSINRPYHCHRVIFNYYKSLIRPENNLYLAPFSIKKSQNIYGLIFGTHHSLGMEKFLNIGWRINKQTGDANFDIDEEKINPNEPKLFTEFDVPTKIQLFERELKIKLESKEIVTNKEVYGYSFESGFLPKHANKVIQEMKGEGKIPKGFKTASQNIHKLETCKINP